MARKQKDLRQKDLKRLKRAELLEIMLVQSQEIDRLKAELAQKDRELAKRSIALADSGSIAEASLKLTSIFDEAQEAVNLYVANVTGKSLDQIKAETGANTPDKNLTGTSWESVAAATKAARDDKNLTGASEDTDTQEKDRASQAHKDDNSLTVEGDEQTTQPATQKAQEQPAAAALQDDKTLTSDKDAEATAQLEPVSSDLDTTLQAPVIDFASMQEKLNEQYEPTSSTDTLEEPQELPSKHTRRERRRRVSTSAPEPPAEYIPKH